MSSASARTTAGACQQVPVAAADGACFDLLLLEPAGASRCSVYWLPAMGVSARHYLPLAQALTARGIAVAIHEWRGSGSSNWRAGRHRDWGYRHLLDDITLGMAKLRQRQPQSRCGLGGHSLGGQLAALHAALHPGEIDALLLVGTGAPYWRRFRHPWLLRMAYALAPLLASLVGHFPGRTLGFAGSEARGVIDDWARSGRTGRYAARGVGRDMEQALAGVHMPVLAMRLADDWLAPQASLDWLLAKLAPAPRRCVVIGRDALSGAPADHFSWMKAPQAVADEIARWCPR